MTRLTVLLIAAASLFLAPSAWAEKVTGFDRFRLWNKCQPISLTVATLSKDAAKIGLTKKSITTAVRSRLRAARLYNADAAVYIFVSVNVVGAAFSINLRYFKLMTDRASNQTHFAPSWLSNGTGTHGENSNYILSTVSQYFDEFIDEYLRVNNAACKR